MVNREKVLDAIKDKGYHIILKDEQENGIWYRLKQWHNDITISLWCGNDGKYVIEFEDWD